jgi:esterase/lipase superfamily enzyme
MADRENIEWATPYLKQLIQGIATRFPSKKIHLVAHSLGNLALFKTVIDLHESRYFGDNWPIGELVLLAPDYDREIFMNETASILAAVPSRVSLYVSSDDIPLMASAQVFHYPRRVLRSQQGNHRGSPLVNQPGNRGSRSPHP